MIHLAPYIAGKGPTLEVDLNKGSIWATWGGEPHEVFEWNPDDYRPGLSVTSEIQMAEDILSFAIAYAADPEQFDRDPDEQEQLYQEFWSRYGESFLYEVQLQCEVSV